MREVIDLPGGGFSFSYWLYGVTPKEGGGILKGSFILRWMGEKEEGQKFSTLLCLCKRRRRRRANELGVGLLVCYYCIHSTSSPLQEFFIYSSLDIMVDDNMSGIHPSIGLAVRPSVRLSVYLPTSWMRGRLFS